VANDDLNSSRVSFIIFADILDSHIGHMIIKSGPITGAREFIVWSELAVLQISLSG
jgi:hypothetical protein